MTKYRYSGPVSGVTLSVDGQDQEVMLHPETDVDLPTEHEFTKTLLARRHLTPVLEAVAHKAPKGRGTNSTEAGE